MSIRQGEKGSGGTLTLVEEEVGSSGWSKIYPIVRELDEQSVKDCKEDIDTLLVFVRMTALLRHLPLIVTDIS